MSKAALLLAFSVILSACGQIFMKLGMLDFHEIKFLVDAQYSDVIFNSLPGLSWVAIGIICYGISLLAWLNVLTRYELSFAYPMLSMSYVLVYVIAVNWPSLGETASPIKTIGILLIMIGVTMVTQTHSKK